MTDQQQQPKNAVAYYRVSRKSQAASGLGLEAQEASVGRYLAHHNLNLVASFVEVETGTSRKFRPEVQKAIDAARSHSAVLVIARLDRLARNVAFTAQLQSSGVLFVCVDMPTANHTTIQMMSVFAEYEARANSQRTKEALQAAKNRGVRLGSPKPMLDSVRALGRASLQEQQIRAYKPVLGYVALMRQSGMTLTAIAHRLNEEGFAARKGGKWSATQIHRLLALHANLQKSSIPHPDSQRNPSKSGSRTGISETYSAR